jgi:hypothetical protein
VQQVENKLIIFPTIARPSKRAVNMHACWAHKQAASKRASAASGSVTLDDVKELPDNVWSPEGSWRGYVLNWLGVAS